MMMYISLSVCSQSLIYKSCTETTELIENAISLTFSPSTDYFCYFLPSCKIFFVGKSLFTISRKMQFLKPVFVNMPKTEHISTWDTDSAWRILLHGSYKIGVFR